MEDVSILKLYWARSQDAIEESMRRYGALCRTVAGNILANAADAEECVNDVWLAARSSIPPARPERLGAYLARLARNIALDKLDYNRAQKRNGELNVAFSELEECLSGPPELPQELPDTLPVFTNPAPGEIFELTPEEEAAQIARVQECFAAEVDAGLAAVEIWSDPRVEFEPGLALPEEYRDAEHSQESAQALGEYLLRTYPQWFSWMETPTVSVRGGDYNIYGEQSCALYVYDGGQNVTDSLTGSAYRSMRLCLNEEGELWLIWICWPDLSGVIGNYPIISPAEAQKLLLEGNYASSVPYEAGGEEAVRGVELCYRKDQSQIWIPYYRFWLEIPSYASQAQLGLNTYGAYYIPAVEGRYIADMSTYDGSFN